MSTTAAPPTGAKFDYKAFAEARNNADASKGKPEQVKLQAAAAAEDKPAEAEAPKEPEPQQPHISRSQRREMNRLREQAARAEGEAAALRLMIQNGLNAPAQPKVDPLDRKNFASDAEYVKAVAKTAAAEATAEKQGENQFVEQVQELRTAADEAFEEQSKLIPKFDEIMEEATELEFKNAPNFVFLFSTSQMRAHLAEYFVKNQDKFQEIIDAEENPILQTRLIARLEAKLEDVYDERVKKAAQAAKKEEAEKSDPDSKDRTHPADAQAGRNATSTSVKTALPKPSSEVSARGGSTPPITEPAPGSREWMRRRNEAFANRLY